MSTEQIPLPPEPPPLRVECGKCKRIMPEPEYKNHRCYSWMIVVGALFLIPIVLWTMMILNILTGGR
jgi:hypothetical protein